MSTRHLFVGLALAAAATTAFAGIDDTRKRKVGYVEQQLELGRHALSRVDESDSRATQLFHIRNAEHSFRQARAESIRDLARGQVFEELMTTSNDHLATALYEEAKIHFERKSLPLAKKRVNEALKLSPDFREAMALSDRIDIAQSSDSYASVANERIRDRRGFPLTGRFVR